MSSGSFDIESDIMSSASDVSSKGAVSGVVDVTKHLLEVVERLESENRSLHIENIHLKNSLSVAEMQLKQQEELSLSLKEQIDSLSEINSQLKSQINSSSSQYDYSVPLEMEVNTDSSRRNKNNLEWEYLTNLLACDNTMSELNNSRLFSCLHVLYQKDVIDCKFHLRKKISNNVACHIAMQLRSSFTTETKWSIFERLFDRKNLRTYENRPMSLHDRNMCKSIDQVISAVQMSDS